MKKFTVIILTATLLLTISLFFASCGENDVDTDGGETVGDNNNDNNNDNNDNGNGSEETRAPATADDIKNAIFSAVTFSEELELIDGEIAALIYPCEDAEEIYAYCNSGAIAEEVVIVKSDDRDLLDSFDAYRNGQIEIFESYNAEEVSKLGKAYIGVIDDYIVYCVSPDPAAVSDALSALTN